MPTPSESSITFINGKKPRIFVGLQEIAGYYGNLHRSFKKLGYQSTFCQLVPWSNDSSHGWMAQLFKSTENARTLRDTLPPKSQLRRWYKWKTAFLTNLYTVGKVVTLAWAALTCDVFIFACGRTFFDYKEIPWLKRLGKTIVVTFNGSDHRPTFLNGYITHLLNDDPVRVAKKSKEIKADVANAERWADYRVGLSTAAQFHEQPFADFLVMGLPFVLADYGFKALPAREAPVIKPTSLTIVHAPSNPIVKGTDVIREVVQRLQAEWQAEGRTLHYVEVINQPHAKVIEALSKCDLVIDELYSDTLMAGLATEAAALGKPSVVCGYAKAFLTQHTPAEALAPVSHSIPEDFEANLRHLLYDDVYRHQLGQQAQHFVETYWAPTAVAQRYLRLMTGQAPKEWLFDPHTIDYPYGVVYTQERLSRFLADYFNQLPDDSLLINDKPALLNNLKAVAAKALPVGRHTAPPTPAILAPN